MELGGGPEGPADVLARIDPRLCIRCKAARMLCGIDPCPLLARVRQHLPKVEVRGRDIVGSSPPSLFVGRRGYPRVGVGPMLPPELLSPDAARRLDDPASWMDTMTIPDVVGLRSSLVRTVHPVRVDRAADDRILRLTQELAMAARPVDAEVRLRKIPSFGTTHVGEFTAPHGPVAGLERAQLTQNVRVERRMEAVTSDTDLRAPEAMWALYQGGTDPYRLERVLSAGLLGRARSRRLVPTRWAITATDDMVGKGLAERVRTLPVLDHARLHSGMRFGNRFHVLLLPRIWSFELVEVWAKDAFWASAGGLPEATMVAGSDRETHEGRRGYAQETAGGYYATRLAVLEALAAMGRQATAIVLREITGEYTTPLGVWVVREACRRAMASPAAEFPDAAAGVAALHARAAWPGWRAHATLLRDVSTQRRLGDFSA